MKLRFLFAFIFMIFALVSCCNPDRIIEDTGDYTYDPVPDSEYEERARQIMGEMTLEEKVGQLFFIRLRKNQAIDDIKIYKPGGLLLFAVDFMNENKKSMKNLIDTYQSNASIPMLTGVDEEGGTVNRISLFRAFRSSPFSSPIDLYKKGGFDLIRSDTREKAQLLLSLGINVNFAPVCDVSTDPGDFIYKRSFGKDGDSTAEYVKSVVEVMRRNKIGSTLKHFPGYGNNADTHTGIAVDNRPYDTFLNSDFIPFKAGIEAGANSVLVSHTIVTCMDKDMPASLSPNVISILRNDLGFNGVVITDDLSMNAIKDFTGDSNAAVKAILAGNDMLISTNFEEQIPAVLSAVKNGTISVERVEESVVRILKWKLVLGIIK